MKITLFPDRSVRNRSLTAYLKAWKMCSEICGLVTQIHLGHQDKISTYDILVSICQQFGVEKFIAGLSDTDFFRVARATNRVEASFQNIDKGGRVGEILHLHIKFYLKNEKILVYEIILMFGDQGKVLDCGQVDHQSFWRIKK